MKKGILLLLVLIGLICGSCSRLMFEVFRPRKIKPEIIVHHEQNREIVFLPMIHMAKPEFYAETKYIVDSLKSEGYVLYYEGVGLSKEIDSASVDTLLRKFRKIMGKNVLAGYTNEENKSLPNYIKKKKFVEQSDENTGITEEDICVDLDLDQLIAMHEDKYGKIELDECDFKTKHLEKYKCDQVEGEWDITNIYRDEYIAEQVLKSEDDKIILMYGKMHFFTIWPTLREAGYTWVGKE